jgi:NADPH:quinone reductase-like Zn-dependent oxidoreductase
MKAVVYTEYGSPDVLHMQEVATPVPNDHDVLIRVRAVSVGVGDVWARNFKSISFRNFSMPGILWLPARMSFGWNKPKNPILGSEFAGEIAAVGKSVTKFKPGDQVFGYLGQYMRANAEYLCMPETGMLSLKPANLSYEEAAAMPGGTLTALDLLRTVNIQPGQKVLIHGASGSIGSAAVQLARYYGADVTGVCSTPRVELVKALGAHRVIDYTQEDFTRNGERYDLIFDIPGKSRFSKVKGSLTGNGRLLYASFKMKQVRQMLWMSIMRRSQRVICALSSDKPADLVFIKELAEAGQLKSILDRCYPLEQAADAHRYYEQGQQTGRIVLMV